MHNTQKDGTMDNDIKYGAEEIVLALYRSILVRDPSPQEVSELAGKLRSGFPLYRIAYTLILSAEFREKGVVAMNHLDILPANPINYHLPEGARTRLWQHMAKVWGKLGSEDPYWSVITQDEYRLAQMSRPERIEQFYNSGREELERAESYMARHGSVIPQDGVCVDYGCGVGRVTLWLARRFRKVIAVDVSQHHIDLARHNLQKRGVNNVEFHLLRGPEDLAVLRGVQFFYSVIALQHNPPPLIVEILNAVFHGLEKRGCAFFQVPTYAVGYSWEFQNYVNQTLSKESMELHALPQSMILYLAINAGCLPLEIQPDVYVGIPQWISNTFFLTKVRESFIVQ